MGIYTLVCAKGLNVTLVVFVSDVHIRGLIFTPVTSLEVHVS